METPEAADVFEWTCAWAREQRLKLLAQDETPSTNTRAKNDEAPETKPTLDAGRVSGPSVYLARRQSAGRGRGSHTWTNPAGSSLLSSWSFAVASVPQPIFSALVGLALYEAAHAIWPTLALNIKAPNDLFIDDKKTAGILIETIDQGIEKRTVIGIGLNVSDKPEGLDTATCLNERLGREISETEWRQFLGEWLARSKAACEAGLSQRLDPSAASRLCAALNLHPLLREPILRVDELGQLHSASRIVHWHEL